MGLVHALVHALVLLRLQEYFPDSCMRKCGEFRVGGEDGRGEREEEHRDTAPLRSRSTVTCGAAEGNVQQRISSANDKTLRSDAVNILVFRRSRATGKPGEADLDGILHASACKNQGNLPAGAEERNPRMYETHEVDLARWLDDETMVQDTESMEFAVVAEYDSMVKKKMSENLKRNVAKKAERDSREEGDGQDQPKPKRRKGEM